MNNRKILYGLLLILGQQAVLLRCEAQADTAATIAHVSISSPTAASLGKYGDVPVSYHTGIPQISIPIYTVKSGSLELPVSLSYHASGLKVQETAGWVGAGWSLNAGGVITRTVVGAPDDRGYSFSNTLLGHYTDFGYNSYYAGRDMGSVDMNLTRGFADGEPDLYFFNFGNYTGKFYFNDDRTPMLIPEQDFKIQPTLQADSGFVGFVITTPDGVRYFFGKTGNNGSVNPLEITNPTTQQNGPANTTAATSSWFLNKVVSADGMDSITLTYAQENYSYYAVASYPVLNTNYLQLSGMFEFAWGINLTKNLVQGVRLSAINFANGTMKFTPAASPRIDLSNSDGVFSTTTMNDGNNTSSYALGSVTITDNNGFCKKDSLFTSYFYDPSALPAGTGTFYFGYSSNNLHSDAYRLRLDSIQEVACDGSQRVPPYRFAYFSESVPRRLSFGVDHWGFANGVSSNTGLVPTFTQIVSGVPQVTTGANRDASWPAMRGGTLQQITYPTGGTTSFDFEPKNVYSWTNSTLQNVPLKNLAVMEPGQSNTFQTLPFTVIGSPGTTTCSLHVEFDVAHANGDPDVKIFDGNNTLVYSSGFISSSPFDVTVTLNPGNYSATLEYCCNFTPTVPATAAIGQWTNVPQTTTQTVGGLRIKTISHNDGLTSNNIVTSYNYTGGGNITQGTLYSVPVYVQILRNDQIKEVQGPLLPGINPNGCETIDGVNAHGFYISGGSIQPMSTVQGENFGYNEVDVSQTGNGHSVYRYFGSNIWNQTISDVCVRTITQSSLCDPGIPTYPAAPVPFEFMRDELQYEGFFNQGGQLLKEIYHYPSYAFDPLTTPGHIGVNMPGLFTYTEYQLQTAKKVKDSSSTVMYDPVSGNPLTTTAATYYNSPYHSKPTQSIVYTSTGDLLVTNSKYAADFRIPGCDAIPDSLPYYQAAVHNDTAVMLSTIDVCTPQDADPNHPIGCRSSTYSQFRQNLATDRQNFIRYRRRSYAPDSSNLLKSCYLTAEGNASSALLPILRLQDEFNNAPIEINNWRDTRLLHAGFTEYDTSLNPLGVAYPGKTQLINLQAPSGSFDGAYVSDNTVVKDSRYQDESLYTFSHGNPQQVTPHSGVTVSYIWDYQNKEPIAKATGTAVDQIAYTSFEADGNGSWTIPSGSRDKFNAITGGGSYNLSNGAVSRSALTSTATYIVSYWSKTGSAYSVAGSTSVVQGKTINGWTYFEHTVTGVGTVTITGSNDIDELRLYPQNAQMTTYTYSPLIGMTSQCDVDNRVTYYNYDALGRLNVIKDQDGNIVKTIQYHYKGQ